MRGLCDPRSLSLLSRYMYLNELLTSLGSNSLLTSGACDFHVRQQVWPVSPPYLLLVNCTSDPQVCKGISFGEASEKKSMAPPAATVESVSESLQEAAITDEELRDAYRSHICGEAEKLTTWRHGSAPVYPLVNALFEKGRTTAWAKGSLEEIVQNLVKTWEMELSHKIDVHDFKTIDPEKFTFSVNGGPKLSAQETLQVGSYNALLATTLPGEHEAYKASKETFDSSHDIFRSVFPGGFAWEVLAVYSGPPVVAFKYRHWGVIEGPFKGHEPTGEIAESIGVCVAKVDENLRIVELEVYYDPTMFLGSLTKGPKSGSYGSYKKGVEGCPFLSGLPNTTQVAD